MKKQKQARVRYLTISRIAFEIVSKLSDADNAQFNRILYSCFEQLEQGKQPEYEDTESPLLNIALGEALSELQYGYITYTRRQNGGKHDHDQCSTNAPTNAPTNATVEPHKQDKQTEHPDVDIQNPDQQQTTDDLFSDLVSQGYTVQQINNAISSVKDWTGIQNKTGYIVGIIKNQKKKILPAQDFPQRPYDGVVQQMLNDLEKEVAEFNASEAVKGVS